MNTKLISFDVTAGSALNAQDEGLDLMAVEMNSKKVYAGKDGKAYMTVPRMNAEGVLEYEAVHVGNASTTTMLKGEWEKMDDVVYDVARGEQDLVNLITGRGLVVELGGPGVTRYGWNRMKGTAEARVDMDMTSEVNKDRALFEELTMPIPFISSGFNINMRQLLASRKTGVAMDVERARAAALAVAVKTEDILLNGAGDFKADGGGIYGFRNTTAATVVADTDIDDWEDGTASGKEIVDSINSYIQICRTQNHKGPFEVILPSRFSYRFNQDYLIATTSTAGAGGTILERLKKISDVGGVTFSSSLNFSGTNPDTYWANEVIICEMKPSTVVMLRGMEMTTYQWETKGPFASEYKVGQILIPLFRSDMDNQSGLLIAKGTDVIKTSTVPTHTAPTQ